ncbi:uracil-DNA glycosylase [Lederbergia lenta]|uniref:Uracil-DNA glycosylase n=1 Tax=Lederbergia lenta TaxID=1467 RepID=A0A2X4WU21_LEDLE|nr:uracil-DNA glycosylase [Lederbergia lenta]MCM3112106.1 uracil-DNA glycosylase [Lederbergia lenta]MEC2323276.1 uracil-DNA glycosylase [Lederbergia lenta]SQI63128.1 uracil-DNA glycosylase [Lederbergia lenta]
MTREILHNDWGTLLEEEFQKPYYEKLRSFLEKEYEKKVIYPAQKDIFNALHYTPYENVKVVIIGQDPYHGPGQAHGLSFSVKPDVKIPPSLRNIFKELHADLGFTVPNNGYLVKWAEQGVLMLNTVLTVRAGEAHSHRGKGWETFTDKIISFINEREQPVVFILWGRPAQEKMKLIDTKKHKVIMSPHPSPFAARKGFFGSKPFSKANEILEEIGATAIDWEISNI